MTKIHRLQEKSWGMGEEKNHTNSKHYRHWDLLLISPFGKAVNPPWFHEGIISRSPVAYVTVPAQTMWLQTCAQRLAAFRTVGNKVHPSWYWIQGRIWALTLFGITYCQLSTTTTKTWEHPVGNAAFPEFSSLCKKLLLRRFCTRPMAWGSTVFPLPHQSEIVLSCALRQRLQIILPTVLLSYQH